MTELKDRVGQCFERGIGRLVLSEVQQLIKDQQARIEELEEGNKKTIKENWELKLHIQILELKLRNFKQFVYYPWNSAYSMAYEKYNPYNLREVYDGIDSIIFFDKEGDFIAWLYGDQPTVTQDLKEKRKSLADRIIKANLDYKINTHAG